MENPTSTLKHTINPTAITHKPNLEPPQTNNQTPSNRPNHSNPPPKSPNNSTENSHNPFSPTYLHSNNTSTNPNPNLTMKQAQLRQEIAKRATQKELIHASKTNLTNLFLPQMDDPDMDAFREYRYKLIFFLCLFRGCRTKLTQIFSPTAKRLIDGMHLWTWK